jgi:hypothetical protein
LATSQRAIAAAAASVSAAAAPVARGVLQFADIDRGARRRGHRGDHLGRHHGTAQPGERAGGVDARAHAQRSVGVS